MAMERQWIKLPEAGRRLQVHPQTVKAWAEKGYLVIYQPYPHAHNLISLASVEAILQARRRALARLEHRAPEGTADLGEASKIAGDFGEEVESGNEDDLQPHKHPFGFSLSLTPACAAVASRRA